MAGGTAMSVAQILAKMSGDHNIVVVRLPFVQWTGSLEAAMLLDKVLYWWRTVDGRPFYKSDDEWVRDIPGSTRYAVRQARDRLVAMGILIVRMDRHPSLPSKVAWYSIDEETFDRSFNEWAGFNSRVSENEQLDAVAPSVERNRTVEDPDPNGRECESERSLSKDASSTSSKTSSRAAEDAGEAARSAAAAGPEGECDADDLVDAEPEPLTLSGAVAVVAYGHEDAAPARQRAEVQRVASILDRDGYTPDDVLDADDHWRLAYERRTGHPPTSARVTQVVQHCAEWRRVQPAGPLFDDAEPPDYEPPDLTAFATAAGDEPPTTPAADLWLNVLAALRVNMARATYDHWRLKDTRALELDADGSLVVQVPMAATSAWLTNRLGETVRRAFERFAGADVTGWRFVVEGEDAPVAAQREAVVA